MSKVGIRFPVAGDALCQFLSLKSPPSSLRISTLTHTSSPHTHTHTHIDTHTYISTHAHAHAHARMPTHTCTPTHTHTHTPTHTHTHTRFQVPLEVCCVLPTYFEATRFLSPYCS